MPAFRVEISEPAELDIEAAHDWLGAESEQAATNWIEGLLDAIEGLSTMPRRFAFAPENTDHSEEIRQVVFGRYRVLFTIEGRRVIVLHVRHGARLPVADEEMFG